MQDLTPISSLPEEPSTTFRQMKQIIQTESQVIAPCDESTDHIPGAAKAEFERLLNLARSGEVEDVLSLAVAYRNGNGTQADPSKYFECVCKCAQMNHPKGMRLLALCYRDGKGVSKDERLYFEWINRSAEAGDAIAMRLLAVAYRDGVGTAKDLKRYFDWIGRSSDAGDSHAKFLLALAFRDGLGTNVDLKAHFQILLDTAGDGGSRSQIRALAIAYRDGLGTQQNPEKFIEWIRAAAEQNDPVAMRLLALAYRDGTAVPSDPDLFHQWIVKAAESGEKIAMRILAIAYRDGVGTAKNSDLFALWIGKAAEAGEAVAMRFLAVFFRDGIGRPADLVQYFNWMVKSAEAGDPTSMGMLGLAYRDGLGTEKNTERFIYWTKKAAEEGHPVAMWLLATAYKKGVGLDKDLDLCMLWMVRAADLGNTKAMVGLAHLFLAGDEIERDIRKSFAWMVKAAEHGVSAAMFAVSLAYRDGVGVRKSKAKHKHWGVKWADTLLPDRLEDMISGLTNDLACEIRHLNLLVELRKWERHRVQSVDVQSASHFTSARVVESMLPIDSKTGIPEKGRNCLRLYHASYMNDPEEGSYLAKFADNTLKSSIKASSRPGEVSVDGRRFGVYLCSLTLSSDRLDLWRAYGANGEGVALEVPLSAFELDTQGLVLAATEFADELESKDEEIKRRDSRPKKLLQVLYGEQEARSCWDSLTPSLRLIGEKIAALRVVDNVMADRASQIVLVILNDLYYLFKSDEYSSEREVRIVDCRPLDSTQLKVDDRSPPRLFVEAGAELFGSCGSRMVLGPRLRDKQVVRLHLEYLLARHGFSNSTVVEESTIAYR